MSIFVEKPAPGENAVLNWQKALNEALASGCHEICFHPGKYDFYPENCAEKFLYFSNNDKGNKRIALYLEGLENFTIRGENTELFFHGRISPLVAEKCRRLCVSGFAIDFEETFVSEAETHHVEGDTTYLVWKSRHCFSNGRLSFCADAWDNLSGKLFFRPFDLQKGELTWDADVTVIENKDLKEKEGLIGVPGVLPPGGWLIKHEERLCPGLVFSECSQVEVTDITIHHAAGMGLLGQFCEDVLLDGIRVIPRGRRVSASDDALHLVECRGNLFVRNCRCAGTLDDSLNVHGIYRPSFSHEKKKCIILGTGHFQQAGLPAAYPGDTVEFVHSATGFAYGKRTVKKVEVLDENKTLLELATPCPAKWQEGDCLRVTAPGEARLTVQDCHFTTLRGRGVLGSGLSFLEIKNCFFHTTGAAIFIAGGCTAWYETGPVENILIENNHFENCCYQRLSSTQETVSVYPDIHEIKKNFYYHGTIQIRNNRFISQKRPQIAVFSAEEVIIRNNDMKINDLYPFDPPEKKIYSFAKKDSPCTIFQQVKNVISEDNIGFY